MSVATRTAEDNCTAQLAVDGFKLHSITRPASQPPKQQRAAKSGRGRGRRNNVGLRNAMIKVQMVKEMLQEEKATKQLHAAERKQLSRILPSASLDHPKVHEAAMRLNQLATVTPPNVSLIAQNNGANGTTYVDAGQSPTDVVVPTETAWAKAVLNGVALGDVRFPDPFRLYPTTTTLVQYSWEIQPTCTTGASSTNPDYAFNAVFKGSPVVTGWTFQPSSSTACDWKYADRAGGLTYNCGLVSADFMERPNGYVLEIIPQLRGIEHAVSIHAMPFAPLLSSSFTAAVPTGWPALFSIGPSPWQRYVGARSWQFKPGDSEIRLSCLPLDSRGLDFLQGNTERMGQNDNAQLAWSGWAIWAYGFTANDSVRFVTRCVDEVYPMSMGSGANYAYPASQRGSDPITAARAVNETIAAADAGLTGIKVVDNAIDWTVTKVGQLNRIWQKLSPYVGTDQKHNPMPQTMSVIASSNTIKQPAASEKESEEKRDDFTPIDKPRDRRNTLPEMLSVDEVRTPRATKK